MYMKKGMAISMILLILFGNIRLGYAKHFCGERVAKAQFIVGKKKVSCGMEGSCGSSELSWRAKSCCKDELLSVAIEDSYQGVPKTVLQSSFVLHFVHTFFLHSSKNKKKKITGRNHPPPLIKEDIQTLYQVFRL